MKTSLLILRVGIGITFLWIGYLISQHPDAWGQMVQPWALALIPGSLTAAMQQTAVLDMAIGILLIVGFWTWLAAILGAIHLIIVLVSVGITDITVRDIGLLSATICLTLESKAFKWVPKWVPAKRS